MIDTGCLVCLKRSMARRKLDMKELFLVAKYNLHRIVWKSDLEVFQLFLSLASLTWALLLFWPGDTFSRPTYSLMGEFGGEFAWGILFLIQGLSGIIVVFFRCTGTLFITLDSILGCILWTGSCVAMLLSVYPPPAAISAEIIAAWFSWWLLLRLPLNK